MQKIKLPFHVVQLKMSNNPDIITTPILDNGVLWVNISAATMASKFSDSYQEKLLDKGEYFSLLDYYIKGDFVQKKLTVNFVAGKQQIAFKKLDLDFDYFVQDTGQGYWIIAPALGAEAFAMEEGEVEESIRESIRLDFMRNNRLNLLQDIISTIWFENMTLVSEKLEMKTYTPSEVINLQDENQKELLPKVAQEMIIEQQQLFGYEKELHQFSDIITGKYNKNTLIVGRSGVGKTTLVRELVRQKKQRNITLDFWETTASTLIKELSGEVGWQENLTLLCKELTKKGVVLFVRNLLELFEVGQYEGNSVSMADYLREYIARGELILVSECTDEEFAQIEARSPNYMTNFQLIQLVEPQEASELERIVLEKIELIANTEIVGIEQEAIRETIRLNKRYTPYSGFPGKPIRFLESILMASKAKQRLLQEKNINYILNRSEVIKAFCEETGMPLLIVDPLIPMDLPGIEAFFGRNVFGQGHAVKILVDILASVKTAMLRQGKPIASMLFVGPTGVGKTEMAKVLAEFMFGSREKMIRFDMSEYSTAYGVARLTGESYFSDGLLTSAVRREPFCVLLFDELEKAHPSFNDLLLQMLGEGRLTDNQGKLVNFCSAIIIMTSNIGAKKLQTNNIAWVENKSEVEEAAHFTNEVRRFFRPEIFNRIDQIVPFYSLNKEVVRQVVDRELAILKKREGILHRSINFNLSNNLFDFLCEKGYEPKYGARALQRSIHELLIIPLAYELNRFSFDEQLVIQVDILEDGKLFIEVESNPLKLDLLLEELTHNEYMDFASLLRQNIFQIFEGRYYIRLLSELDILARDKQQNTKEFWEKEGEATRYTNFLALQDKFEQHQAKCEHNELQMALVSMGHQPLDTQLYEVMETWEKDYFKLKLELYNALTTESNELYLGIYGQVPAYLLNIYIEICKEKGFEWTAKTVWYRESWYNKVIENENELGALVKEKSKEYYKKSFSLEDKKAWEAEESEDILMGVELLLKGVGVQLYFNEEGGGQLIVNDDNSTYYFWVESTLHNLILPDNIHRKSFFQNLKVRRTFLPLHLEDTVFKFPKRELKPVDRIPFLIKILDKSFVEKLDVLLF